MKYIIMGLFSLLAVTTQAQVRGIVKDNTGEPVPGANVFWVNTGQGVTTKEDGSFSISKPSKSHMLVISFIGFQNDTVHVSKKNQELDITLREGVELNEVNVVSRRMGTMKLRSSVMNEEMISSAELSRAACCNLGESFVTNPSVDVSYSDAATGGMTVFRDNTTAPMVHFLSAYMSNKSITNDDLKFLTNGACDNTSESYINGQRLVERDITCQNGYIQVLENVMNPLTNMAEAIHNDGELSTFSKMLDRFAVPVYNEGLSNTVGVDSAFVWRYLNNGFDLGTEGGKNALLTYKNVDYDPANVLSYDPGWNQYQNGSSNTPMSEDMAVIVAPTDAAFERYFQSGGGAALIDRYKYIDSIPNHIIVNMLDNFMKYSLVATVPSKFSSVMNTAQLEMGLSVGEPGGQTGKVFYIKKAAEL